jgi:hypothetical protein
MRSTEKEEKSERRSHQSRTRRWRRRRPFPRTLHDEKEAEAGAMALATASPNASAKTTALQVPTTNACARAMTSQTASEQQPQNSLPIPHNPKPTSAELYSTDEHIQSEREITESY